MGRKLDPERHEARRQAVLDAAIGCFAEKGFHGTSTAEICKAAGMSPGNLFHYFASKTAIIAAVAEHDRADIAEIFATIKDEDAITALENIAETTLRLIAKDTYSKLTLEIAAESARSPEVAALFQSNDALIKAELIRLLKRGVVAGQIDPELDCEAGASWLYALTDGAVARAIMDKDFSIDSHLTTLKRLIRRFVEKR